MKPHNQPLKPPPPPLNFGWNGLFHCISLSSLLAQRLELTSSNAAVLGSIPVGRVIVEICCSQYAKGAKLSF